MHLQSRFGEDIPAPRAALGQPEQAVGRRPIERALRQIEAADAEVLLIAVALLEGGAQRLRLRQGVIDSSAEVHAIGRPAHGRAVLSARQCREDVRGVVQRRAPGRQ
jgi:hypothetical protein